MKRTAALEVTNNNAAGPASLSATSSPAVPAFSLSSAATWSAGARHVNPARTGWTQAWGAGASATLLLTQPTAAADSVSAAAASQLLLNTTASFFATHGESVSTTGVVVAADAADADAFAAAAISGSVDKLYGHSLVFSDNSGSLLPSSSSSSSNSIVALRSSSANVFHTDSAVLEVETKASLTLLSGGNSTGATASAFEEEATKEVQGYGDYDIDEFVMLTARVNTTSGIDPAAAAATAVAAGSTVAAAHGQVGWSPFFFSRFVSLCIRFFISCHHMCMRARVVRERARKVLMRACARACVPACLPVVLVFHGSPPLPPSTRVPARRPTRRR